MNLPALPLALVAAVAIAFACGYVAGFVDGWSSERIWTLLRRWWNRRSP